MLYPDLKYHAPKARNSHGGEFKTIEAELKRKYGNEIVDELRDDEDRRSGSHRGGTSNGDRRRGGGRFHNSARDGMNQTSINTFFSKKGGPSNSTGSSGLATLDDNDMWDDGESAGPSVAIETKAEEKVEPVQRRSPSVEIVSSDYSHRSKDSKDDWDREERRSKKRKTSIKSREASSDRSRTPREKSREKSRARSKGKSQHRSRDRSRSRERQPYRGGRSRSREYDESRRKHRKSRSRNEDEDEGYNDRRSKKRYASEYDERPAVKRPPSPEEEYNYSKTKRVSHYERPAPVSHYERSAPVSHYERPAPVPHTENKPSPQMDYKPSYAGGRKFNSYEHSSGANSSLLSTDDMWDNDSVPPKQPESLSDKLSDYIPPPPPPPTATKTPPPPPPVIGESGYSAGYYTQQTTQPPPPPAVSPPREKASSKKNYDYLFEAPTEKPTSQYEHKKASTSTSSTTPTTIPVKSITDAQFTTAAQIHATLQKLNAAMSTAARNGASSSSSSSTSSLTATLAALKKSSSATSASANLNNSSSSSSSASTCNATGSASSSSSSVAAATTKPTNPEVPGKVPNIQLEQEKVSKKNLADVVIRFLMPYYRQQKIKTKELFKGLARTISHKFYDVEVVVDRKVKKYIDDLMAHKGLIASEADFPN